MTRAEIERLEGRELDAAVAEQVMGLAMVAGTAYYLETHEWHETEGEHLVLITRHEVRPVAVPNYSTAYEGMGLVLEAMAARGWWYRMGDGRGPNLGQKYACFSRDEPRRLIADVTADTLPEAVARAALLAVSEGEG